MIFGLHISTKGNLAATPARAKAMGAEVIQIFASNPRGWRPTVYSDAQAAEFKQACNQANLSQVFIHMIYLVSYGSGDQELRRKSIEALAFALQVAEQLGATGIITHLGSHHGLGLEQALDRLTKGLAEALKDSQTSRLILENSAGSGGNIGNSIEEMAQIIDRLDGHPRLGVCLDTAHLLASGYEIRQPATWYEFLAKFDQQIGLKRLLAMHMNDSKVDLGKRVDRHENIGDGYIGNDGFKAIINHPDLKQVPGMLEVPGLDDKGPDQANLERLKKLANA